MDLQAFYAHMAARKPVEAGSPLFEIFHLLSQEALQITMDLNSRYHTPAEIVTLFSRLTGKKLDASFRLFPPFYTDCGKNITIGKNVFINAGCVFQDQGGIFIGDGVLVGHHVTLVTLNHDERPEQRQTLLPAPIRIEKNVWIGSNATILQGVTIGEGAIIGAGSLVTKDIPPRAVAFGAPARVRRMIA